MALINEHVVKEEILKVVSELYNRHSYAFYDDNDDYIDALDREDFEKLLTDLSQELTKILK